MKRNIVFAAGLLFGLVSAYPPLGWIVIFNTHSAATHSEKQAVFYESLLVGLNPSYAPFIHIAVIICGILSITIFAGLLKKLNQRTTKPKEKRTLSVIYIILLIAFSAIALLNIWFLL
ncbi:MAG: hypothetical protein ACQERC_00110 [Bacteroidota bacterium]